MYAGSSVDVKKSASCGAKSVLETRVDNARMALSAHSAPVWRSYSVASFRGRVRVFERASINECNF